MKDHQADNQTKTVKKAIKVNYMAKANLDSKCIKNDGSVSAKKNTQQTENHQQVVDGLSSND